MVMTDNTDHEVEYMQTYPLSLKPISTIWVKQEEEHCKPVDSNLLDSSENEISGNEADNNEKEEMKEGKQNLPGMPEDDYELALMPSRNNAPARHYPNCTVEQEDQDFEIQYVEELYQVDSGFNTVALIELELANDPNAPAQLDDQANNANVDW